MNDYSTTLSTESYGVIIADSFQNSDERRAERSEDINAGSGPLSAKEDKMINSDYLE